MTTNAQGKEILVQPSVADGDSARICIPTWRLFRPLAARAAFYEAQDVFLEVDNVDLIPLEAGASFEWREKWQRRLLWRDFTGKVAHLNPGIKPVKLRRDYELLVVMCQQIWELLYLNAIDRWRDRCRLAVCWLDELWAADIPTYHYWFNTLNQFDHVFVGLSESARVLDEMLGRPCHYLPSAVDVLRFNPYPTPADRVIDVLSIGRRWDGVHRSLLGLAGTRDIFYVIVQDKIG